MRKLYHTLRDTMMKMMNGQKIVTVAYIIVREKKLLLVRRKGMNAFYMPGGKLEESENDAEALVREVSEELSITIDPQSIKYAVTVEAQAYAKPEGVKVIIRCHHGSHTGEPKPSAEIRDMKYFSLDEYLSQPETAPAVRLIFQSLVEKGLVA